MSNSVWGDRFFKEKVETTTTGANRGIAQNVLNRLVPLEGHLRRVCALPQKDEYNNANRDALKIVEAMVKDVRQHIQTTATAPSPDRPKVNAEETAHTDESNSARPSR